MDGFLWLAISVGALILLYFRPPPPDKSINLHKQISRRPVIKFRLLPVIKVTDKQTQTEENKSPMSLSLSLDFPFDFDEEYLNRNHSLQYNSPSSCENQINGSTEL